MSESIGFATDPLENLCGWANRLMQTNTALGLAESLAEYAEAWQKERGAMKARVAELEDSRQWQPIERFSEQGLGVYLLMESGHIAIGYFDGLIWHIDGAQGPNDKPTHWMPLPEAPK